MTTALVRPELVVSNGQVDWRLMRNQLDQVNAMAMQDLIAIVRRAQELDPWSGREYLTEAFEALVSTYGGAAGELTAAWWDEIMAEEIYFAQPASLPSYEQLRREVAWGVAQNPGQRSDVLSRMALLTQKHIFGAHRNTVDLNALNTKVGYARYAQPDACAFCRILASRGAVYGSESAALYVGAASVKQHYSDGSNRGTRLKKGRVRGVRKAGQKYHDHCRCVTAPISRSVDPNIPDYADRFLEEYQAAVEQAGKDHPGETLSLSTITKVMREQGSGK